MSADTAILSRSSDAALKLDFEMPLGEYAAITQKTAWASRHPWLMPSIGVAMIASAAFNAGLHYGADRAAHSWMFGMFSIYQIVVGWIIVTNFEFFAWINRKSIRGTARTRLELDSVGIRGMFEVDSPWEKRPAIKRINYIWRQIRKIHHPADCIVLEFHGGGTVMLPEIQFDTLDDMRRCLDWAERGLAEQKNKHRTPKPAAA